MKNKYTSSVNFEYYWFGPIYISIQEKQAGMGMGNFATIRTEQSVYGKREFEYFEKMGLLIEITNEEFESALKRAISIINECAENSKIQ